MLEKKIYKILIGMIGSLALVFVVGAASVSAQIVEKTKDAAKNVIPLGAQDDDDEKLDESFRKFGQAAGAAYQCVPEADREKLMSEVRRAYNRIGQLFGTDRAFYFATHFGKATDDPFDKTKCGELTTKLRESVFIKRLVN